MITSLRSLREQGFTLTELMVVVAIVALLALVAVPALTKDRQDARFFKFVRGFAFDVRRAHMEAISSKDHRQFAVRGDRYSISAATKVPKVSTRVLSLLANRLAPPDVQIAGIMPMSSLPNTSYLKEASFRLGPDPLILVIFYKHNVIFVLCFRQGVSSF